MINNWVFIGDSLTYANWNAGTPQKNLLNRLSEKFPENRFVNLGVNSDTTAGVVTRKATVDAYNPFRVVIWIGINDIALGVAEATIKSNLQTLIDYYHNQGYEVWVMTITPQDDNDSTENSKRDSVNSWIKNTATSVNKVIDSYLAIRDPNNVNLRLSDYADPNTQNHINDAGFAAIASLFDN